MAQVRVLFLLALLNVMDLHARRLLISIFAVL
jgi:hypothetical protein